MQMRDAQVIAAACDDGGFGKVDQMQQALVCTRTAGEGKTQGGETVAWAADHPGQRGLGNLPWPTDQDMFGACIFGDIGGVDQLSSGRAHGKAVHIPAQPLQRLDFAADEAVRGTRVGVDEIGEFHEARVRLAGFEP